MMELHVLAMIGCVGFDMVKHAVKIFQGQRVASGGNEVNKIS